MRFLTVLAAGRYVPPSARSGSGSSDRSDRSDRDEQPSLRLTNLAEDTHEQDIAELMDSFGRTSRVFVVKDSFGACRGSAYVSFYYREDAARALAALNGKGFRHLILSVEWAKPSNK